MTRSGAGSRHEAEDDNGAEGRNASAAYSGAEFSTNPATMRLTTGVTTISTGNATHHDIAHATGQTSKKFGAKPMLRSVEIPDTMHVMNSDTMTSPRMGA